MSVDDFAAAGNPFGEGPVRAIASPDPTVTLWLCDLERDAATIRNLATWLSREEHARAARFGTEALRWRYIVGRATLRQLLGIAIGASPADVPIRRGDRGRPELAIASTLDFNVSHTRGVALIGFVHAARIGVDIERADRTPGVQRLARKFLTRGEAQTLRSLSVEAARARFLRYWTCKEAMSKATGHGLAAPFGRMDVALDDPPRLTDGPPPYVASAWKLLVPDLPCGHLATVALWSRTRPGATGPAVL